MIAYMSFEWLKLSKRWMPRIIVVLMVGLLVVAFWGQATRAAEEGNLVLPRGWLAAMIYTSFFAPFFWPVLGGSWAGNEYGWGTIRMILTRRPYRIQYVLASLAVLLIGVAISIVVLLVIGSLAGLVIGALTATSSFPAGVFTAGFLGTLGKSLLAAWYVGAFYLVLAFAAATVFRSAAVGIGIGIGSTLAEFIMRGIFSSLGGVWNDFANHFPVVYSNDLVRSVAARGLIPGTGLASVDRSVPSAGQSILALAIYMAILLAITLVAVSRRDVTA